MRRRRREREPVAYLARHARASGTSTWPSTRACSSRGRRPSTLVEAALDLPRGRAGGRRRHRLGRDRAGAQDERPDLDVRGDGRRAPTRWRSRGPTPRGSASTSSSLEGDLLDAGRRRGRRRRLQPALRRATASALAPDDRAPRAARARCSPAPDGLDVDPPAGARGRGAARRSSRSRSARGRRTRSRRSCAAAGFADVRRRPRPRRHRARGGRARDSARRGRDVRALHRPSAASRCSRPTRSTAWPATPTTEAAVARLYALKGRAAGQARARCMFFDRRARARRAARARPAHARRARALLPGRA